jgi:hypothetical protein
MKTTYISNLSINKNYNKTFFNNFISTGNQKIGHYHGEEVDRYGGGDTTTEVS